MAGQRTREWGELESQAIRILRASEVPLSAREVQSAFDQPLPAYTTVMTALDRLQKKGEVIRTAASPRKVRFHAARSVDEHASSTMLSALADAGDRQAALLSFAGNLHPDDLDLLRQAIATARRRS